MKLQRIEISGFRGIKRLSLSFDELTVLIGENAWGKSSLLDALDIALSPYAKFHTFTFSDFHIDYSAGHAKMNQLHIVLHWQEDYPGECHARRYRAFSPVWIDMPSPDKTPPAKDQSLKTLLYQISSTIEDDKITTRHAFLDRHGEVIPLEQSEKLARQLMVLHPVVRIRDARRLRSHRESEPVTSNGQVTNGHAEKRKADNQRIERRLDNTCRRLMTQPGHVSQAEIKSSINALHTLVDHYFAFTPHTRHNDFDRAHFPDRAQYAMNPLEQLTEPETSRQSRLVLMGLLNAFIRARGPVELKRLSRPIMILEDPEGRLHPTICIRHGLLSPKCRCKRS
ncbi:predicted ATP-dependent endonuclease of the OLD family YbjD subgroup [Photobacterium aphoticum]|uniref:Predicted ATP-dependent endonuclease of the OLD family YbjD subgroup n=1 Tax=Photobacterium aphoticum TaxID=754436 RepID=A0A090R5J5_9GAMM|nr:predicted ATP-dependent endonuclease of the OLD family YbjD subgroup [Photobacterium aphoticum]